MSNFDKVVSDTNNEAERRRKEAMASLAELDRMPSSKPESGSEVGVVHNDAGSASSSTALARSTAHREGAVLDKSEIVRNNGLYLTRGNSAQDNELIEEVGIAMKMCGFGDPGADPLGQQLCALAGLHPPSEHSFRTFFKTWFEFQHFPGMSEALKHELVQRAKTKGFFSGLSSQVKKWAMATADTRLQADAWHAYFMKHAPPTYKTYGCLRIAFMNLGAVAKPCWLKFYGMPAAPDAQDNADQWVLMPWTSHDADICALIDELDGRGGMTALLEAAALEP